MASSGLMRPGNGDGAGSWKRSGSPGSGDPGRRALAPEATRPDTLYDALRRLAGSAVSELSRFRPRGSERAALAVPSRLLDCAASTDAFSAAIRSVTFAGSGVAGRSS